MGMRAIRTMNILNHSKLFFDVKMKIFANQSVFLVHPAVQSALILIRLRVEVLGKSIN